MLNLRIEKTQPMLRLEENWKMKHYLIVRSISLGTSFVFFMITSGCMMAMHSGLTTGDSKINSSRHSYERQIENATDKLMVQIQKERLPVKQYAIGEISYGNSIINKVDVEAIVLSKFRNNFDWIIVDRKKISKLLEEQKIGQTGLMDEATAPVIGKIIGVDHFLFVTVNLNNEIISLSFKIIDVSSGKILWIGSEKGI